MDYYQQVYPKCFIRLVETFVKYMQDSGGSIIAVSSPGCNVNHTPKPMYMLPGQAKTTLEYLSRHYALLLAPKRITVNVVVPGFTRTEAWEKVSTHNSTVAGHVEMYFHNFLIPLLINWSIRGMKQLSGHKGKNRSEAK